VQEGAKVSNSSPAGSGDEDEPSTSAKRRRTDVSSALVDGSLNLPEEPNTVVSDGLAAISSCTSVPSTPMNESAEGEGEGEGIEVQAGEHASGAVAAVATADIHSSAIDEEQFESKR